MPSDGMLGHLFDWLNPLHPMRTHSKSPSSLSVHLAVDHAHRHSLRRHRAQAVSGLAGKWEGCWLVI